MDQNKLNRLLYYLEYRIHTGYEAARPAREEEKDWAEMLMYELEYYDFDLTNTSMSDLLFFIRFIRFDNTRNKCISCEFEEYVAGIIKFMMSDGEREKYEEYLENLKN